MKVRKLCLINVTDLTYHPQLECYSMKCHFLQHNNPKIICLHENAFSQVIIDRSFPQLTTISERMPQISKETDKEINGETQHSLNVTEKEVTFESARPKEKLAREKNVVLISPDAERRCYSPWDLPLKEGRLLDYDKMLKNSVFMKYRCKMNAGLLVSRRKGKKK